VTEQDEEELVIDGNMKVLSGVRSYQLGENWYRGFTTQIQGSYIQCKAGHFVMRTDYTEIQIINCNNVCIKYIFYFQVPTTNELLIYAKY
jgi:hypothetical protein